MGLIKQKKSFINSLVFLSLINLTLLKATAWEPPKEESPKSTNPTISSLEKKLELLSKELEGEADHAKQQDILKSINSLIETIEKIKNKQ